ncbi:MAG: universal stress protein [Methylococcaceae bacterium]
MAIYQHILLAVDFFQQDELVIDKAKNLALLHKAHLSIVHVVDNLPIYDIGYGENMLFNLDLAAELMEIAKQKLAELALKLQVTDDDVFLEMGCPKLQIVKVAQENNVDLIVLGSHGRHGLALLLGSTANGVLHYAACDVLAVRLADN